MFKNGLQNNALHYNVALFTFKYKSEQIVFKFTKSRLMFTV